MEEILKLKEQIRKLVENQGKIVSKIQEMDLQIKAYVAIANAQRDKLGGLETALLGANVLTKEGLDLHQSFNHEKLGNPEKTQETYGDISTEARKEEQKNRQPVFERSNPADGQAEA